MPDQQDDVRRNKAGARIRPRLTPEEKEAIIADRKAGLSRNQLAAKYDRSGNTITIVLGQAGMGFAQTPALRRANETFAAEAEAKRVKLANDLLDRAQELLDATKTEHLVYAFGGRDNIYNEHTQKIPPSPAIHDLMRSVGIAITQSYRLTDRDGDSAKAQRALLSQLGERLGLDNL